MSALEKLRLPPKVSLHAACVAGWALLQYDKDTSSVQVQGKIAGLEFASTEKISSYVPAAMGLVPFVQKVLTRFESTGDESGDESVDGIDVHLSGVIDGEEIKTQTIRVPLRVGPMQQLTAFNTVLDALRKKMKK